MFLFNVSDFCGKVAASFFYTVDPLKLLFYSCVRIVLIPLFCLTVAPRGNAILQHESFSMLLAIVLGTSNGIFGSLPMIIAPSKVAGNLREISGNLMTLSYSMGLTVGSLIAYLIDYGLGDSLSNSQINAICTNHEHNYDKLVGEGFINNSSDLVKLVSNRSLVDISL